MPRRDGTGPIGGNVNSRPRMGMKRSGGKGMGGSGNCICPR